MNNTAPTANITSSAENFTPPSGPTGAGKAAAKTAPVATLRDLVAAVGHRLTPVERKIAEVLLKDSTLPAFGTVSALADRVGVSRPSIVRFANKLGFDGYTELQTHVQRSLSQRLSRPADRIRQEEEPVRAALGGAIRSVFTLMAEGRLQTLAAPLARAENVWILSGETSRAGGHVLYSGLSMVRPNVRFVHDYSMGTDLSTATAGDAAVVIDFFRYRRSVVNAAKILAKAGVEVVAVTDSPLSPLVELTDTWCKLEVPAVGPFDSSVSAVTLAELLVSQVARNLRDQATARIDRIEELWDSTETFLPD